VGKITPKVTDKPLYFVVNLQFSDDAAQIYRYCDPKETRGSQTPRYLAQDQIRDDKTGGPSR